MSNSDSGYPARYDEREIEAAQETLRARTIFQPYAWAIFAGFKWWETSTVRTRLRGRVWVHAARTPTPGWMLRDFWEGVEKLPADRRRVFTPEWLAGLPRGAVLGSVEIVDVLPAPVAAGRIAAVERPFGDWREGRWAWKLANPILLPRPVPAPGRQGWWSWPE